MDGARDREAAGEGALTDELMRDFCRGRAEEPLAPHRGNQLEGREHAQLD